MLTLITRSVLCGARRMSVRIMAVNGNAGVRERDGRDEGDEGAVEVVARRV